MPSGYVKSDMERLGVFKEMSYISVGDKYTPPHNRLTGDQWLLLRSGKPDGATLIVVADLVLEVVTSLTKAILAAFTGMKTSVSEESIRSAQTLDVTSQVEDDSVELCAAVISKEVAESVNSALSTPMHTAERVVPPPPPRRLNVMPRAESPVSVVSLLLGGAELVRGLSDQELRKITDPVLEDLPDQIANTAEGITAVLTQQKENQERMNVDKSTNPKAETMKSMMSLMSGVGALLMTEG
ncbi:hypothetical protein JOQ06_023352, partial [Pogonophryne albipinna]